MSFLLKPQGPPLLQAIEITLPPEVNKQHQLLPQKHMFLLKNNKTGDIKKLTPVTPHKSVQFNLTNDSKGSRQGAKDKPTQDLINLVQSDEIPTDIDRDTSETEPNLPFTNDKDMANIVTESSNDEEWQLIDSQ